MIFQVPERHKTAFDAWLRLDEGLASAFAEAVEKTGPHLRQGAFAKEVAGACPELGAEQARVFLELFFSMSLTFKRGDSVGAFLDDVFAQLFGQEESLVELWKVRRALTVRLVSSPTIGVTAKALLVMAEHDRILVGVRTLSELRPVFDEASLTPQAFVAVHQLKLEFQHNDREEALFIAMDREDLVELRDVVARAIAKHDALREVASASNLPLLEV